ncbi:eCIS core domain-containing protein [Alkalilimnicola ehrlichii MLHE-1]|uniref:Uncharacterized protein n=1 Tax=Alkalilimnicola ehrlichii (strain ATCC BAA-1101 / DSM 17681 / MLHE-1) TaxID=187272 RepID=Q0A7U9_ALKEH|nr:DUF4157 domain-containing protein [Alkalilimnicola ehrlichii]ABI57088.1 hypothetical protein Mlg_1742 [Alkalilimnicola ehrlichii MLHE-1]
MVAFAQQQRAQPAPARRPQPVAKPHSQRAAIAAVIGQAGLQPRLKLGARDDPLEREAERTAERVTRGPAPASDDPTAPGAGSPDAARRAPPATAPVASGAHGAAPADAPVPLPEEREEEAPGAADALPEPLARRIGHLQQGGRPLPEDLRAFMEPRFGQDFSAVRIHTDDEAARLSEAIHAHAFTLGEHIAFNRGAFRPDSRDGRRLIAHELTHVVQQRSAGVDHQDATAPPVRRSWIDSLRRGGRRLVGAGIDMAKGAYDRLTGAVGDIFDKAGNFIASKGMAVVEKLAPNLAPILQEIIDKGPVGWLKDRVAAVFDRLVEAVTRLTPEGSVERLSELFSGMLERAGAIVEALASGDCGPLFDAIRRLRTLVTDAAGAAWDRLTDFLAPVGNFFADLWESTGARALDFITGVAGDLWDGIKALGRRIWNWTRPIRETLGAAWDWVKGKLFGSSNDSSGNDQGGLVGWVQDKAGEAWDWIKARTRPLWQPIQQGVEWLRELVPPAFVKRLGEDMQALSNDLGTAEQQMAGAGEEGGPGAGVAENRAALANALPTVEAVLARVRGLLVDSGRWLVERLGGVGDKVAAFFSGLRQLDITRPLARALGWLERGIAGLSRWAESGVKQLFDGLVAGFDRLTPFIERMIGVVRRLLSVVTDLMQLPQLVLSAAWRLIPECIRKPVQDFIVNQILARIPVFGQLLALPDLWEKVKAKAMEILRKLFVDGDLAAAAWAFFQAALRLIGLPPELVVSLLANAAAAIGHILQDPIGFLLNLVRAAGRGFSQFFSNIVGHLKAGIAGWLFGTLRKGGIEPPEDFSLRSILGVVLQILDITTDRIFDRIGRQVGSGVALRMRRMLEHASGAWQFLRTLVEEGPGALWAALRERLSDLGGQVLDSIINWVSVTIIKQASIRLTPLLAPTGVSNVIALVMELYRVITALTAQLRALLEVANRFLAGVAEIASGALGKAADYLEDALGRAVPPALAFLAHYAGLGDVSSRIREMVEGIRERVDAALDWLIERALRLGEGFVELARRGGRAVRRGARALVNWWQAEREVETEGGERHTLSIDAEKERQALTIESRPTPYAEFIAALKLPDDAADTRRRALAAAEAVEGLIGESRDLEGQLEASAIDEPTYTEKRKALKNRMDEAMDQLSTLTRELLEQSTGGSVADLPSTPAIYGPRTAAGFGSSVRVELLTRDHPTGSTPRNAPENESWNLLRRRMDGGGTYYVRGHLLNEHLGGPGDTWDNLTPLTQGANNRDSQSMLHRFEDPVKDAVEGGQAVNYIVTANYGVSHPLVAEAEAHRTEEGDTDADVIADIIQAEQRIPRTLDCSSEKITPDGKAAGTVASHQVDNRFKANALDDYSIRARPKTRFYIDDEALAAKRADNVGRLAELDGVDHDLARAIVDNRPDGGYRRSATLKKEARMTDAQWEAARKTDAFHVHFFRRS